MSRASWFRNRHSLHTRWICVEDLLAMAATCKNHENLLGCVCVWPHPEQRWRFPRSSEAQSPQPLGLAQLNWSLFLTVLDFIITSLSVFLLSVAGEFNRSSLGLGSLPFLPFWLLLDLERTYLCAVVCVAPVIDNAVENACKCYPHLQSNLWTLTGRSWNKAMLYLSETGETSPILGTFCKTTWEQHLGKLTSTLSEEPCPWSEWVEQKLIHNNPSLIDWMA